MWQTRWALDRLAKSNPGVRFTVVKITSDGDANLTLDLDKFGKTGVFTDALEQALLAKEVDVLVHSLKDMPSTLKEGTALAAIGPREDPRDVLVFHPKHAGCKSLAELPANAVIGTSSARRRAQLAVLRPDINFRAVRGNVMTRLRKLDDDSEGYDALCLAAAGLKRLHLDGRISAALSTEDSLHAIGQGAIGIQVCQLRSDSAFCL
jgi:hydroxymethylbilane synthase